MDAACSKAFDVPVELYDNRGGTSPMKQFSTVGGTEHIPRGVFRSIILLFGIAQLHCGTMGMHNTISVPCMKPREHVLREAQQYLARLGFEQRVFLPDSGYFRTKALRTGTVAQSGSGSMWYVFEVQQRRESIDVRAYNLIARPNSESRQYNTSPEDEPGVEENPVLPGDRYHMMIVEPFLQHLRETCGK